MPAWLAGAKDRTRFLISGAEAGGPVAKTSKPNAAIEKIGTKKVVAKKAQESKSPVAGNKTAVKKTVAASAKRAATKKVDPVDVVAANADSAVARAAPAELSA